MIETQNAIIGGLIIIINLIPLVTKKYKLIYLTSILSLFLILILNIINM